MNVDAFGQTPACSLCSGVASGSGSVAVGGITNGINSSALGINANAGDEDAVAIGEATSSGLCSFSFGKKVFAKGDNSFAIGYKVEADVNETYNYIFGRGLSNAEFVNDISNSMMFGMNSDISTVFIKGASGTSGSLGRVGIGTTDPDGILHIQDENNTNTEVIIERGAANSGIIRFHQTGASTGYVRQYSTGLFEIANEDTSANLRMNVNVGGTPTTVLTLAGANGNFGVNTPTPGAPMDVRSTTGGNEEVIARFRVSDSSDEFFRILNRSNDANEFAAWLEGGSDEADNSSIELTGRVLANANTGAVPVVQFSALHATPTTEIVRPLFQWSSNLENFMILDEEGNLGIGTTSPARQLHLSTNSAGKPGNSEWDIVSDANYKTDIEPFEDGLSVIMQINPISYRYNGELGLPSDEEFIGVTAQQMQPIAPYTVGTMELTDTEDGSVHQLLSYNGAALKYVIINALKELAAGNDSLRERTQLLENELTELMGVVYNCCNSDLHLRQTETGQLYQDDTRQSEFVLNQNDPNPFSSSTDIRFTIPESTNLASLIVFDSRGRTVNKYELTERGAGMVTVYGSDVENGIYFYSLVLDGKIAETKQMVHTD